MPNFAMPNLDALLTTLSYEWLLIAGRAVMLAGALMLFAWAFARWRRQVATDTQRVFEQLDLLQGQLHELTSTLGAVAARVEQFAEKAAAEAEMPASPVHKGYENAIRLAQRGGNADEIVNACGLARHEAELLVRLHGKEQAGGTETVPAATRKHLSIVA